VQVRHVEHPHPQAEIARLVADASKAERVLRWRPTTSLGDGVARTTSWLERRAASAA
jgi:UDP-glucose 4-epimerase